LRGDALTDPAELRAAAVVPAPDAAPNDDVEARAAPPAEL